MSQRPPRSFATAREDAAERVLLRLRSLVRASARTQRSIERVNGFQRGYLSQVLQGHITLTVRHLLGILKVLDLAPSQFFAELEGQGGYSDMPMLLEIRERMARYDAGLEQLAEKGLLEPAAAAAETDEAGDDDEGDDGEADRGEAGDEHA